jgi:hypothetical protein
MISSADEAETIALAYFKTRFKGVDVHVDFVEFHEQTFVVGMHTLPDGEGLAYDITVGKDNQVKGWKEAT